LLNISHAIDNPDTASELALLQGYGPNVPVDTLRRLTLLFADLRKSVDEASPSLALSHNSLSL